MTVGAAWERFLSGEEPPGVRGEVLTSWRRSRISGVDPEYVDPPYRETELDTHFARVAVPIMTRTAELFSGDGSALALADQAGCVLWRWVSEPSLRTTLDELSVAEHFCFEEESVGTNGLGTALETGRLAVVRGSEHFVHRFHHVTCVAAPVRHPITRRTVGAVNVTCRAEHTNPLLAVVVGKLVEEIEAALLQAASARERVLLDAFLDAQRSASGPVISLGADVAIVNAAAAELELDHRDIWQEVRGLRDGAVVELPAELTMRMDLVRSGGATAGAVLRPVTPQRRRPPRPPEEPDRWAALVAEIAAVPGPVVVLGEPGAGKTTVLRAAYGPQCRVVDAWRPDLPAPVIVRQVQRLPTELPAGQRVGFTVTLAEGQTRPELGGAHQVVLPPLRRRIAEISGLARRELARQHPTLTFTAAAMTALRRYHWPGNVRELVSVVEAAAAQATGGLVGPLALPQAVRASGGRRALTPLERAESSVIAAVLAECGGNKSAAAKALGISRTALYGKIRSYRL